MLSRLQPSAHTGIGKSHTNSRRVLRVGGNGPISQHTCQFQSDLSALFQQRGCSLEFIDSSGAAVAEIGAGERMMDKALQWVFELQGFRG
jgi:hypothetical protein